MRQFIFTKENARKTIIENLKNQSIIIILGTIAGLIIVNIQYSNFIFKSALNGIVINIVSIIFIYLALQIGVNIAIKSLMKSSFNLYDDKLEHKTSNGMITTIKLSDIVSGSRTKNGIEIKSKYKNIFIPSTLDDFDILTKELISK